MNTEEEEKEVAVSGNVRRIVEMSEMGLVFLLFSLRSDADVGLRVSSYF